MLSMKRRNPSDLPFHRLRCAQSPRESCSYLSQVCAVDSAFEKSRCSARADEIAKTFETTRGRLDWRGRGCLRTLNVCISVRAVESVTIQQFLCERKGRGRVPFCCVASIRMRRHRALVNSLTCSHKLLSTTRQHSIPPRRTPFLTE